MVFFNTDIEELLKEIAAYFVNDVLMMGYPAHLMMIFEINELGELLVNSLIKNTSFNLTTDGELEIVYNKN